MTDPERDRMARSVAADLLRIGAVQLRPSDPFTWASGLRSPVYCDNRLTIGYPDIRRRLTEALACIVAEQQLEPEVIVGTATAGIPHAAWLADVLHLPMAYVRSRPKEHGKGNQIEGVVTPGQRALIIEDLVSTGMSSTGVVHALRAVNAQVVGVLAVFSYGLRQAEQAYADLGVPLFAVTTFAELAEVAEAGGLIDASTAAVLDAWRADPVAWSAQHA